MAAGVLSISFDFEMAWGSRRSSDPDHAIGVERVREVVPALLDLFTRHNISATWATVGHLMLRPQDCPDGRYPFDLPAPKPSWFNGDWYDGVPSWNDPQARRFYAPELVEAIVQCPAYQELASHTFSHVVIGDDACTAEVAEAEFIHCREVAATWGREIHSLVFPRNQVGHLDLLRATGHRCFRSTNTEWYQRCAVALSQHLPRELIRQAVRAMRFVDETCSLAPYVGRARRVAGMWELPYGMFFSGHAGLSRFLSPERLVTKAIKGLRAAAKSQRIFSLYTHPHNFLPEPEPILAAFQEICEEAARLRDAGQLEIKTMEHIADDLEHGRNLHWADSFTRARRRTDGWFDEFPIHPQPTRTAGRFIGRRASSSVTPEVTETDLATQSEVGLDVSGRPVAAGAVHEAASEAAR